MLCPEIFTLCTIFGRMPGFELELLRQQPGVLPMSYTHPMSYTVPVFQIQVFFSDPDQTFFSESGSGSGSANNLDPIWKNPDSEP